MSGVDWHQWIASPSPQRSQPGSKSNTPVQSRPNTPRQNRPNTPLLTDPTLMLSLSRDRQPHEPPTSIDYLDARPCPRLQSRNTNFQDVLDATEQLFGPEIREFGLSWPLCVLILRLNGGPGTTPLDLKLQNYPNRNARIWIGIVDTPRRTANYSQARYPDVQYGSIEIIVKLPKPPSVRKGKGLFVEPPKEQYPKYILYPQESSQQQRRPELPLSFNRQLF